MPHVGWARVDLTESGRNHPLLGPAFGDASQFFYHVHSYYPTSLPDDAVLGTGDYGGVFPTLVGQGSGDRRPVPSGEIPAGRNRPAGGLCRVEPMTSVRISLVDVYVLRGAERDAGVSGCCAGPRGAAARDRGRGAWAHRADERPAGSGGPRAGRGNRTHAVPALQPEPGGARSISTGSTRWPWSRSSPPSSPRTPGSVWARSTTASSGSRPAAAKSRFAWPRERRALEDIVALLREGHAGTVDDVLRVC